MDKLQIEIEKTKKSPKNKEKPKKIHRIPTRRIIVTRVNSQETDDGDLKSDDGDDENKKLKNNTESKEEETNNNDKKKENKKTKERKESIFDDLMDDIEKEHQLKTDDGKHQTQISGSSFAAAEARSLEDIFDDIAHDLQNE